MKTHVAYRRYCHDRFNIVRFIIVYNRRVYYTSSERRRANVCKKKKKIKENDHTILIFQIGPNILRYRC